MGLKELYAETEEIYQTINEANKTLNMPYIEKPIYEIPKSIANRTVNNVVEIANRKKDFLAKEIGGGPEKAIFGIAFGLIVSVGEAVTEVGIDVAKDVVDNVAVKSAAKKQLDIYKKTLAVKQSLIINEQQSLIKEKTQIKNAEKEKQIALEKRIETLSKLIEKCNRLLKEQ